jgi:hypothetical protein
VSKQIIQIVPATPGWWAYYSDPINPADSEAHFEGPVALWALLEDEAGRRFIQGVDPTGTSWTGDEVTQDCEFVYRPYGPSGPQNPADSSRSPRGFS